MVDVRTCFICPVCEQTIDDPAAAKPTGVDALGLRLTHAACLMRAERAMHPMLRGTVNDDGSVTVDEVRALAEAVIAEEGDWEHQPDCALMQITGARCDCGLADRVDLLNAARPIARRIVGAKDDSKTREATVPGEASGAGPRPGAVATDLDLDAIEARAKAATPGPWCEDGIRRVLRMAYKTDYEACDREEWDTPGHGDHPGYYGGDPAFIAAARTDVDALIAEVRMLRGYLDASRARAAVAEEDFAIVVRECCVPCRIAVALTFGARKKGGADV